MSHRSEHPQPPTEGNVVDLYPPVPDLRAHAFGPVQSAGGPHRVLEELVERLERQADRWEAARDPGCVFARALARINHRLSDGLLRAGWDDPEWVALLGVRTTSRYLQAAQARDAGQAVRGVWAGLFEAAEHRQTSVREELVLGMTAYLVHDLPHALVEVGLHTPSGDSRLRDYHAINDPLGLAVEDLAHELTRRYQPWFAAADQIAEDYTTILSHQGVRIARATAWYNAQRLLDEQLRSSAQAAVRRWPLITLYELLHPPVWSSRFAARGMRLVSNWSRRWPGKRPGRR